MSNMSYCRFENTFHDLEDCAEHIHDGHFTGSEKKYRERLIQLCKDIAEECDWEEDEEDEEEDDDGYGDE